MATAVKWTRISANKQRADTGHIVLRYNFGVIGTPDWKWLLYQPGADLNYGDYQPFDTLKQAKDAVCL